MSEEFEMKVRLQRQPDGSYAVLGVALEGEDEAHAPHGKPMMVAIFRWMRKFVLPGVNRIEKMSWGFGQAPLVQGECTRAYMAGPKVVGEPIVWNVGASGAGQGSPYYKDPNAIEYHAHQLLALADRWREQRREDEAVLLEELRREPGLREAMEFQELYPEKLVVLEVWRKKGRMVS